MEMEPRAAAMTTIQVGDGGGWSWVEVRKVVGVAAEDWLMETLSRRMILVSNIKFAKKSSKMKTEPWPLEVGSGKWEVGGCLGKGESGGGSGGRPCGFLRDRPDVRGCGGWRRGLFSFLLILCILFLF